MALTQSRRRRARPVGKFSLLLGAVLACTAGLAQASPPPVEPHEAASSAATPANAFAEGVAAFDLGKYEVAFQMWLPLAKQGRSQAQFNIAYMYEKGLGVAKNDAEAMRWYLAAAELGDPAAQSKVASLYETGTGVAKDAERSAYWHARAAQSDAKESKPAVPQSHEQPDRPSAHAESEDVTPFEGGRYVLRRAVNKECVIALQGTVTQSTSYKFDDVLQKAKVQGCTQPLTLLLESPGGLVDAGITIGRSVHDEGMRTVARYACASSCANIFLGGSERILWGSRAAIGLHQPSLVPVGADLKQGSCVTTNFDAPVIAMRRYLRFVLPQTSDRIMEIVVNTPCKSITWIKGERAIDLGVATRVEAEHEDVFGPMPKRVDLSASASH